MSIRLQAATLSLLALAGPGSAQPLPATNFAATHNSYSGNISGQRGSIQQQLDAGARFIEYDINLGNYSANGDYQIGHGSPGSQVDHTPPNPSTNNLAAWLQLLAAWSDQNPGHAPVTLGLDSKDDLSGQDSPQQGNPSALNAELEQYLGARLFTAAELGTGSWPDWQALKGRILVVLSGNQTNRQHYRSDQGKTPAVAINAAGQAIVAYQSTQTSTLWYWFGAAAANGAIGWPLHGKYDSGVTPAVAIDPSGVIVEVHKSQSNSSLYSHVGIFRNGELKWGASQPLGASGSQPSVAFTGANTVSEIHQGGNGQNQLVTGTVNPQTLTIQWSAASATTLPRYPTTTSTAGAYSVTVQTGNSPAAGTLLYSTPQVSQQRVVYPQVMFTEFQKGDSSQLGNDGLSFYACSDSSSNWSWAGQQRQAGKIVRIWSFDQDDTGIPVAPNFPATDTPYAGWYTQYCGQLACQQ